MTCKDCLHHDVCWRVKEVETGNPMMTSYQICRAFKDKSRFIELPCKVGDTVFTIYHGSLSVYKVKEFIINDFLWAKLYNPDYSVEYTSQLVCLDFSFDEFVFLTREEAEKALKEREKQ